MWNPLRAWFDHRERMAVIKANAANAPFQALLAAVEAQNQTLNQTVSAQNNVLKEWLEGFKSTTVPVSTVLRDEDEFNLEEQRQSLEGREDRWTKVDPQSLFPALGRLDNN